MSDIDVSGWSCDERKRTECRNAHGCHCREITALRAQVERQTWQPMETAPQDVSILVLHDGIVSEAWYDDEERSYWLAQTSAHDFDAAQAIYPTAWRHMPSPPASPLTSDNSA